MPVIFGPSPVALHIGDNLIGPVAIDDTVNRVLITISRWTNTARTVELIVETSFDSATTWRLAYSIGPIGPPVDRRGNLVDLDLNIPAWRMCVCGQPYDPTLNNSQVIVHSDHFGWTSAQIAALPDLSSIVFHTPTPAAGPLRQLRANAVASGNVNTTATVETI